MTLIEMLTVLFVVSILVAFVTGTARYASRAAETRRAQADLQLLADALDRYYLRFGEYPPDELDPSEQNDRYPATVLLNHTEPLPGQDGQYYSFSNSLPQSFTALDPWGSRYQYIRHTGNAENDGDEDADSSLPETFQLFSLGPDGKLEPDQGAPDDNIHM